MARRAVDWWIVGLALAGLALSLYALPLHFDGGGGSFCNVSEQFNCDVVNRSVYSTFLGIPVALLGAIAYLALAFAVLMRTRIERALAFTHRDFWQYALVFIGIMLLFQLYLTAMEVFFLKAYCILCLGSQAVLLALGALAARALRDA